MAQRRSPATALTTRRAARIQETLREQVILTPPPSLRSPAIVAGADVSYNRGDDTIWSAVVVMAYPSMEIIETAGKEGRATFPYIPGYLSFREIPILMKAFDKLRTVPDVILCDGQGIAHPRRVGLASHLGLLLGIPTIGCAKSLLIGSHGAIKPARGSRTPLRDSGQRIGTVLRTRDRVAPLFISPGHLIDHVTATRITLACCKGLRLPEPTRQAHLEVNRLRKKSSRTLSSTRSGLSYRKSPAPSNLRKKRVRRASAGRS
jgi:deoxyribonuclease V